MIIALFKDLNEPRWRSLREALRRKEREGRKERNLILKKGDFENSLVPPLLRGVWGDLASAANRRLALHLILSLEALKILAFI
jgi:hypothetical protein